MLFLIASRGPVSEIVYMCLPGPFWSFSLGVSGNFEQNIEFLKGNLETGAAVLFRNRKI